MINTFQSRPAFAGCVWYQEAYFLKALQLEIDRARGEGSALSLIFLHVPPYTRDAARHLFAFAEARDRPASFGLLSTGDYAICLPGRDFTEGTRERLALARDLGDFDVCSGLAILDREETAVELLNVAAHACACVHGHFEADRVA